MAMECPRCGHVEDTRETVCPTCGSGMHLTLIRAGEEPEPDREGRLDPWRRALVADLHGLLTFQSVGLLAAAVGIFVGVGVFGWTLAELLGGASDLTRAWMFLAFLIATACMVRLRLRGVYLVQLHGAAVGAAGVWLSMLGLDAAGVELSVLEWLSFPLVCAAIGFVLGLRLARSDATAPKPAFFVVETWDPDSKPTERELPLDPAKPMNQLVFGVSMGLILFPAGSWLLELGLGGAARQSGAIARFLQIAPMITLVLSLGLGGLFSAAGTKAGLLQGILAGVVLLALGQLLSPARDAPALVLRGALALTIAPAFGWLGRALFRPNRLFGNISESAA